MLLARILPFFKRLAIPMWVFLVVGALGTGYLYGKHRTLLVVAESRSEAIQMALELERVKHRQAMQFVTDYYASREPTVEEKIITKRVVEYVESDNATVECFDSDELQLITDILDS